MPKNINEAINFDGMPYEDEEMDLLDNEEEYVDEPVKNSYESENMSAEELINDIRKKSLRAMADLADTPEDPNYETLKKIFTMLDRAVSEKNEPKDMQKRQ